MRIVWKDSAREKKPIRYRGYYATGYKNGWTINIPGDDNIYKTHYCALNAIDKALGSKPRIKDEKRSRYGINIIGTRDAS